MMINFKKVVGIVVLLVSISCVEAQTDSTDLNFYTTEVEMLTAEDTIMYSGGGFKSLHLEFDTTPASGIIIMHPNLRAGISQK